MIKNNYLPLFSRTDNMISLYLTCCYKTTVDCLDMVYSTVLMAF